MSVLASPRQKYAAVIDWGLQNKLLAQDGSLASTVRMLGDDRGKWTPPIYSLILINSCPRKIK